MTSPPDRYSTGVMSHDIPTELDRLHRLERLLDPTTRRVLSARELPPDARCLVLGAGAGSVARWLAGRFPDGQVTAVDIDTRYLEEGPNLRVLEADLRTVDIPPGSADLVHARAVLMHLPDREDVLARAAGWLAPGGWLVDEDISVFPGESSPYPAWRKTWSAIVELVNGQGADLGWPRRRLPGALADAKLTDLGLSVDVYTVGDGGACEQFWRAFLAQLAPALQERGLLSRDDIDAVLALFDDPAFIEPAEALISAWGRRPRA